MQIDEYVPITTPINIANKNPLIAGPPNRNIISITKNKIIEVLNVRLNVVFKDLLITSSLFSPYFFAFKFSRIRSKTITVSFIE